MITSILRKGRDKITINGEIYSADNYVAEYCEEQERVFNLREYGSWSTAKFLYLMELSFEERQAFYTDEINKSLDSGFVIFHPYIPYIFAKDT